MKWSVVSLCSICVVLAAASIGAEQFCGGMTQEKAALILGCSAGEVQFRSSAELHSCSFSKDLLHSINYSLYREKNADAAQKSMEKVAQGLQMLVACQPVTEGFDAGFSCDGDRAKRLLLRKGANWVDVRSPTDIEQKRKVATAVLEE